MNRFLRGLLQFIIVLALLYLTGATVWTLLRIPLQLNQQSELIPAAIGFGGGILFFLLVSRVLVLYVFGHELTHWVTAKLFMRDTGDMNIGTSGGNVAVQSPNIWITLAPYFVPFYTLLWIGVYGIFRFGYGPPNDTVLKILFAGIGLTYAFHVVLTAHSLVREQSDLRQHGYVLSLTLILCINVMLLAVGLISVNHQWRAGVDRFLACMNLELDGTVTGARWCWEQLKLGWNTLSSLL